MAEVCSTPDAVRCSMMGAGNREKCSNGTWTAGEACASGQTCVTEPSGESKCVMVADLCRGSGGQTICDAQGSLVVCNADESIGMMMACESAKHCQAGMATQTCATCIPGEEHQCTGVSLEQCAPDGMSFMKLMDCATEGLCNTMLGQCTDAVCDPGKKSCDGNKLITCNADGTAVEGSEMCMNGMCDAEGGDCNVCQPGTKKCEGDMVTTCDAKGQTWQSMACPSSTPRCVGLGQCVQCASADDCSDLTEGCKVGACTQNRCTATNVRNGTQCDAAGGRPGMCSNGACQCTKQCSGKECGEDGCGGSCGSCSGGQMCANSQCVECTSNSQCRSTDPCMRAVCSDGACDLQPVSGTSCGTNSTCRNGSCVCQPDCSNRCGGSNGCNGTCPDNCAEGEMCGADDRCAPSVTRFNYATRCDAGDAPYDPCANGRGVCHALGMCTPLCRPADLPCPEASSGHNVSCAQLCQIPCALDGGCPSGMRCIVSGDTAVCGYQEV